MNSECKVAAGLGTGDSVLVGGGEDVASGQIGGQLTSAPELMMMMETGRPYLLPGDEWLVFPALTLPSYR